MDRDDSVLSESNLGRPLLGDEQSRPQARLPTQLRVKALRVMIDNERSVDVALLEQADALAMHAAVTAALRDVLLGTDSWWLVDGSSELIVPLCSALPDGCQLSLRTSSGKIKGKKNAGNAREIRALTANVLPSLSLGPPLARQGQQNQTTQNSPQQHREDRDTLYRSNENHMNTTTGYSREAARDSREHSSSNTNSGNDHNNNTNNNTSSFSNSNNNNVPGAFRSSFFNLSNALSKRERDPQPNNISNTLVDFERMTKLTTDLANERTLLAWCRTALAVERTVFAFLGFKDSKGPKYFQHIYFIATAVLASYAVFVGVIGVERFYKIKNIINKKEPPAYYFRVSVQPAIVILGVVMAVVCVSIYGHFIARA